MSLTKSTKSKKKKVYIIVWLFILCSKSHVPAFANEGFSEATSPSSSPFTRSSVDWFSTASTFGPERKYRKVSDAEEFFDFVEKCPSFRSQLQNDFCRKAKVSCKNRCRPKKRALILGFCNCDIYCLVYNDCCWDFESECPHVAEQYDKENGFDLTDVRVNCVGDNIPVIDSCGDLEDNKTYEQRDERMPIVSVDDELIFRNLSTYHQCFGTQNNRSHVISYWDHFISIGKVVPLKNLQDFFLHGTIATGVYVDYISPKLMRGCSPILKVLCNDFPKDHACHVNVSFPGALHVLGSNLLCGQLQDDSTNPRYTSTPALSEKPSSQQALTSNYPQCQIFYVDQSNQESRLILPKDQLHVAMGMNFRNGVNQPFYTKRMNPKNVRNGCLKRYKCAADNGETPCNIIAECARGYIPVDLICRKASVFVVRMVGKQNDNPMALETLMVDTFRSVSLNFKLFSEFDENQFLARMEVLHKSRFWALTSFLPFKKTNLVYSGIRLPLTDFITQNVQIMLNDSVISKNLVAKITLCFMIERDFYRPSMRLCDRLFSSRNGSLIFDSHFTTLNTTLSDPFIDIDDDAWIPNHTSWNKKIHRPGDILMLISLVMLSSTIF